jgi:hypothetical protein
LILKLPVASYGELHREEVLTMFEVTQKASDIIKEALKDREEISPIRIMLRGG